MNNQDQLEKSRYKQNRIFNLYLGMFAGLLLACFPFAFLWFGWTNSRYTPEALTIMGKIGMVITLIVWAYLGIQKCAACKKRFYSWSYFFNPIAWLTYRHCTHCHSDIEEEL